MTQPSILPAPKAVLPRPKTPQKIHPKQQEQQQHGSEAAGPKGGAISEREELFTDADWDNVIKGYTSQYVERDYWVDASMVEGAHVCLHLPAAAFACSICSIREALHQSLSNSQQSKGLLIKLILYKPCPASELYS